MSLTSKPVMVGVDGTTGSNRGVRYAALEAVRLSVPLSIVHVSPGETDLALTPDAPGGTLRNYGLRLLEDAGAIAHEVAPSVRVERHLASGGTVVSGLVECADRAALMVLGAERRSFPGQVWTGDIVAGVAARAHVPVVAVPAESERRHVGGPVVVGLKDAERSRALVTAGMALADQLGTELLLLHAWKAPAGYDDIVATQEYQSAYRSHATARIEALAESPRRTHPDVAVRIEVLHAQPAYTLVEASTKAQRVLISRPLHVARLHHLGGTGRALLRDAHCPVEVHPCA